jgi:hypothetical protein
MIELLEDRCLLDSAPPVPGPGQTVTWAAAQSPFRVSQSITIPASATVVIEPGVQVDFNAGTQLLLAGIIRAQGTAGGRIRLTHPAVFPPMIDVAGGRLEAAFTDFGGQVRPSSGATVLIADSTFAGNGLLANFAIPSTAPFVQLERNTFTNSSLGLSDCLAVLRNNTFLNSPAQILRGYADVAASNTFTGQPLTIIREESSQPLYINGVQASGVVSGAGLRLEGGNYLLGPNTTLQNNLYAVHLLGGLLPGSTVPLTGNTNNVIEVGDGGFRGFGQWSNLGLPYRVVQPSGDTPGGQLTIEPGVTVEAAAGAPLIFRSTRRLVADGLPEAPITFRATAPDQRWQGIVFATNSTEGSRLEYVTIRDANFGVIATDATAYLQNSVLQNNAVGANTNTFGNLFLDKTQFLNNAEGVRFTDTGRPILFSPTNPNAFDGNAVGVNATEAQAQTDARGVWWGHPTGPNHPQNPGGQGDPVIGPGASGVSVLPFLTARPDFANTPPVVRLVEPGRAWTTTLPPPDYYLEPGSKYLIRWDVRDSDAIVKQRILFSPDGHYPDRFVVVADNLPPQQRSFEWTVPNPGFALTNQPQFLRVVAVDQAGQEGWDQMPLVVSSGRIQGELTITTDLSGRTFYAGDALPTITFTGQLSGFPLITRHIVLEADGTLLAPVLGKFPNVSTDTARLAIQARSNSNDVRWFFAPGYFSIRHDPRLNLVPPTVQLVTPLAGASFAGGTVVPITWTASAPEGLYAFDIQGSYDGGRTWRAIAQNLPGTARSFDWQLPPSSGIPDVRVRVIARDLRFQNSSSGGDRSFRITPGTLAVAAFTTTSTGFTLQFNQAVESAVLNLYASEAGSRGPADVTLVGASTGPVRGSLVIDPAFNRMTFVQTGGVLPPDTYTLRLRSASDGFRTPAGALLDGNADGTPGDDYVATFTVSPSAALVVSVPDFARGPGQRVDVPADRTGLPLHLSNGSNVIRVSLTLHYDPALLTLTGAAPGPGVPAGASVTLDTRTPGTAVLTLSGVVLPPGPIDFVTLTAMVPDTAPYGAKQLLDLTDVQVNAGSTPVRDDDGVQVIGYFGDTTGNGGYSALDATRALRVAVGLDAGFDAYPLADPVVLADITGNGVLSSADATRILQEALGIDQAAIPPLPPNPPVITPGGPDPLLRIPRRLRARPGGTVRVPVMLDQSDGLQSVDLAISYDPRQLELVPRGGVRRGRLTGDFDLFLANLDAGAGTLRVGMGRSAGPITGRGGGSVLWLTFRVRSDAPSGRAVINLRHDLGGTSTQLNEGGLDLNPDPSNEAGDALDGQITILRRPSERNGQPAQAEAALAALLDRPRSRRTRPSAAGGPTAAEIDTFFARRR